MKNKLILGAAFLYGLAGSGSVGSQSVNFPLLIGVNEGLGNGSSFLLPQNVTTFVPTAQWSYIHFASLQSNLTQP